jgi:hypothetical protein
MIPTGPIDPNSRDFLNRAISNAQTTHAASIVDGGGGKKLDKSRLERQEDHEIENPAEKNDGVFLSTMAADDPNMLQAEMEAAERSGDMAQIHKFNARSAQDDEELAERGHAALVEQQKQAPPTATAGETVSISGQGTEDPFKIDKVSTRDRIFDLRNGVRDGLPVPPEIYGAAEKMVLERVKGQVAHPDQAKMRNATEPGMMMMVPAELHPFMGIHDTSNQAIAHSFAS